MAAHQQEQEKGSIMGHFKHALLPLAILAAVPASANVFFTGYTSTWGYGVPGFTPQESGGRIDGPSPSPITIANGTGCVRGLVAGLDRACATVSNDYTGSSLAATVNLDSSVAGSTLDARVTAQWENELRVSFGSPGASGLATFRQYIDWEGEFAGAGPDPIFYRSHEFGYYIPGSGRQFSEYRSWADGPATCGASRCASGSYAVDLVVPIIDGQLIALNQISSITSNIFHVPAPGFGFSSVTQNVRWGGLVALRDSSGANRLASATVTTPSGVDLLNAAAVAGVPEPHLWAQMIAGFAFLGAALRGRRRRAPAA
jgi:hypothetical protein